MEVEIEVQENVRFTPFNLNIRIESRAELINMYQRMSSDSLESNYGAIDKTRGEGGMNCQKIWQALKKRIEIEERK